MGIWMLMLCVNLIIPAVMIGFGRWSLKGGPKDISWVIGYRTEMSMKNEDTWAYAHKELGRLWTKWGWILLLASVAAMLAFVGQSENTVSIAGCILMFAQLIPLIGCIAPVERKLRETFDRDGKRKAEAT